MAEVWSEQAADRAAGAASTLHSSPDVLVPPDVAPQGGRDVLAAIAADAGLRRAHFVAWRDLDDPEAGGSELHAHRIATLWADAGIDVTVRTSAVPAAPAAIERDGYRSDRRAGRYAVFPSVAWDGLRHAHRPGEGLVEIWNGMPFFSPLWYRGPRIVFLHHVHAEMWRMVLRRLVGPGRRDRRAPVGAAALPAQPGRHPVRVVAPGDRRHARPARAAGLGGRRRASSPGSRRARPSGRRCRSSSPSAGSSR